MFYAAISDRKGISVFGFADLRGRNAVALTILRGSHPRHLFKNTHKMHVTCIAAMLRHAPHRHIGGDQQIPGALHTAALHLGDDARVKKQLI